MQPRHLSLARSHKLSITNELIPRLISTRPFAPLPRGSSCYLINVLPTPGSSQENKTALSDPLPPPPMYQVLNSSVCRTYFPTPSTQRSRISWCHRLGSSGDNQASILDRSSATVKLFNTLIVFEVLLLLLKYCNIVCFCWSGYCRLWVVELPSRWNSRGMKKKRGLLWNLMDNVSALSNDPP